MPELIQAGLALAIPSLIVMIVVLWASLKLDPPANDEQVRDGDEPDAPLADDAPVLRGAQVWYKEEFE